MFNNPKFIQRSDLGKTDQKVEENKTSCDISDQIGDDAQTERAFKLINIQCDNDDIIDDDLQHMQCKDFNVRDTFHNSSEEENEEVPKKTISPGEVGFNGVCVCVCMCVNF